MGPRASRSKARRLPRQHGRLQFRRAFFVLETRARETRTRTTARSRHALRVFLAHLGLASGEHRALQRQTRVLLAREVAGRRGLSLDSTLDLLAQCLLAVAAALGERPDPRFPVGARRLEAAAVIVVAAVFAVGAAEVATECVSRLARGASAPTPTLTKTDLFLLFGVVAAKLALFAACVAFTRSERAADRLVSPSIKALAADHAADALTNGVALLAAFGGRRRERRRGSRGGKSEALVDAARGSPTLWEASSSPVRGCSWGGACRPGTTSPSWSASEPRGRHERRFGRRWRRGDARFFRRSFEAPATNARVSTRRESRTFSFVPSSARKEYRK